MFVCLLPSQEKIHDDDKVGNEEEDDDPFNDQNSDDNSLPYPLNENMETKTQDLFMGKHKIFQHKNLEKRIFG